MLWVQSPRLAETDVREIDGDDERIADAIVWLAERGLGVDRIDE